MKIFALQGSSNSGKTTTLLKLIDLLLEDGAIIRKDLKKRKCKDSTLILKYRNCQIGITSLGDTKENLLSLFSNAGHCRLCVCACRSKGETVATIEKYAHEEDRFFLYKRRNPDNAESENSDVALRLLELIRWAIRDMDLR